MAAGCDLPHRRDQRASGRRRWLIAVLGAALATGLRQALQPVLHDTLTFVFAYPVMVLIALRQGFGPALLTAILCALGALLPSAGVSADTPELPARIGLFGVAAIVISLSCAQTAQGRRQRGVGASTNAASIDTPLTRWLQAVIWGAALIPLTLFAAACWWGYGSALATGKERVTRANLVTLRHAERTFRTAADLTRKARDLAARPDAALLADRAQLVQRLQDMALGLSAVQAIMVWDASGRLVLSTARTPRDKTPSIADRGYFEQARSSMGDVFFTDLIKGRMSGIQVVNAVARRTSPDGSFAGLVVVALFPGYFQEFYQSLVSEETGLSSFAMFRSDGSVLARWPPPPEGLRLPDNSRLAQAARTGQSDGIVRLVSQFDRQPRMISFMRVAGTPVYTSAALTESSVFDPWYRFVVLLAAVLVPVTLGLLYVSWVALKKTRREQVVLLELQAQIRRLAQTEKALAQAQRLEALSVLTGGVAHDFNNLLAIVNGNLHMIRRQHPEVGNGRHMNAVARAVAAGVRLTRQLLSFARRQALKPEEIALQSWLPGMADLLKSTLGNGIDFEVEVAPDVATIHVDAGELELALINLATNAKDAMTQHGTLRLTARAAATGEGGRAMVVIQVSDTGCGIAPELLQKVFEPFFTTKPPNKGTGLGLSQVYGFCLQAGGAATVESVVGVCTTVSMALPANALPVDPGAIDEGVAVDKLLIGAVLLVEDNPGVATTHRELLEAAGLRVTWATNAADGLQMTLAPGAAFDLVLSDIAMPGALDGLQLAFRLRELRPALPVILLTGYAARVQDAVDAGFAVLAKPIEPRQLIATVGEAMRRAGAATEGAVRSATVPAAIALEANAGA